MGVLQPPTPDEAGVTGGAGYRESGLCGGRGGEAPGSTEEPQSDLEARKPYVHCRRDEHSSDPSGNEHVTHFLQGDPVRVGRFLAIVFRGWLSFLQESCDQAISFQPSLSASIQGFDWETVSSALPSGTVLTASDSATVPHSRCSLGWWGVGGRLTDNGFSPDTRAGDFST